MSTKSNVTSFLRELKQIIKLWDIYFIDRDKNSSQNLADIGITANKRKDIIQELEVENYSQGPLEENQYGGTEMWVFGKVVKNDEVYIKLTINRNLGNAICISFHKAEFPMSYPLID